MSGNNSIYSLYSFQAFYFADDKWYINFTDLLPINRFYRPTETDYGDPVMDFTEWNTDPDNAYTFLQVFNWRDFRHILDLNKNIFIHLKHIPSNEKLGWKTSIPWKLSNWWNLDIRIGRIYICAISVQRFRKYEGTIIRFLDYLINGPIQILVCFKKLTFMLFFLI